MVADAASVGGGQTEFRMKRVEWDQGFVVLLPNCCVEAALLCGSWLDSFRFLENGTFGLGREQARASIEKL